MQIREIDRQAIQDELEALNDGYWLKLVLQVFYFGKEMNSFFLISDGGKLPLAFGVFKNVISKSLIRFNDTEFNVSFWERRGGHRVLWDSIEDEELRCGKLRYPLGKDPDVLPLRGEDVFGVDHTGIE